MAWISCFYWNLCQNLLSIDSTNKKLADVSPGVSTKSNITLVLSLRDLFYAPAPAFAITNTNNKLFKQFMKAHLENQVLALSQAQAPPLAPTQAKFWEKSIKAHFPNLYYRNFYLDCYRFG